MNYSPKWLTRNPLVYPAGLQAGYNPTHIAASPFVRLSAVAAVGVALRDIRSGVLTSTSAGCSSLVDSVIGPAFKSVSGTIAPTISGDGNIAWGSATIALIFIPNQSSVSSDLFHSDNDATGSNGYGLNYTFGGAIRGLSWSTGIQTCSITLTAGRPYFIAFSKNGSVGCDYILRDLASGSVKVDTQAAIATAGTPTTNTFVIGGRGGTTAGAQSSIAAVMFSGAATPLNVLRQWSADPWSFWYPDSGDEWIAAQAAAGLSYSQLERGIRGVNRGIVAGSYR